MTASTTSNNNKPYLYRLSMLIMYNPIYVYTISVCSAIKRVQKSIEQIKLNTNSNTDYG